MSLNLNAKKVHEFRREPEKGGGRLTAALLTSL